jgi:hypothetical protein
MQTRSGSAVVTIVIKSFRNPSGEALIFSQNENQNISRQMKISERSVFYKQNISNFIFSLKQLL